MGIYAAQAASASSIDSDLLERIRSNDPTLTSINFWIDQIPYYEIFALAEALKTK